MGDEGGRAARSSVLRLRGLPFAATEGDVEEFFKGFELKQVQICKRNGRSTGEAYVQLESEVSAGGAMQELNCKHMGRRYIEIFEASESDLSPGGEGRGSLGYVLRLRGLPYSSTRDDVDKFFEGVEIQKGEEGVVFSCTASGRPTGEAYVEFASEEAQLEAMKRHKEHMGSRYVELFKSTKADLLQALEQNRFYQREAEKRRWLAANMPSLGHGPIGEAAGLPRGSPYAGGVDDVARMFEGFSLGPQPGVQVTPQSGRSGEPSVSGMPYGHFQAHHEARGPQESQQYVAPHTMQPGQPNVQAMPPDVLLMQQQYIMQQQMMQQQQQQHQISLRYPGQVGWGNVGIDVPPHSAMPTAGNAQAPYAAYPGLSTPGIPMGSRGGFPSGPFGYHQYATGPMASSSASLPSPAHASMEGEGPQESNVEISAGGASAGEGNGGDSGLGDLQG
ncbi:unnamed protein product [Ostreobium quekettii]|uniref:RRM domain-containing protein n=1 Tax=Ostreobium quekettii TaxID=121088 RepID=A0A8S1ILT8_9CHLO|nr:unnamed protein product [Ostreobium quekettii]